MQWNKHLNPGVRKLYDLFIIFAVLTVLAGLWSGRPLLIILFAILLAFLIISKQYDKKIGTKLYYENSKRTIRMFPGETEEIELVFNNKSRVPTINGRLFFELEDTVRGLQYASVEAKDRASYKVPLSLLGRGETVLSLPFKGQKRGIARIQNLNYYFPHLTGFDEVSLKFLPFCQTEFIVYPSPKVIEGIETTFNTTFGTLATSFSPFEDLLSPMGTRDYVQGDPFQRINWKATARKQTLQTKVYEKNWDNTWVFVINITATTRLGHQYMSERLESILSYVTYMCYFAAKKGFAFELYINAIRPSTTPFFHLYEGEGREHLKEALELLARVEKESPLMRISKLLHRVDQQLYKPKTIIMFGEKTDDHIAYASTWQAKGLSVYQVEEVDDVAFMTAIGKEVKTHVSS